MSIQFSWLVNRLYTRFLKRRFKSFGTGSTLGFLPYLLVGAKYMEIGCNTTFGRHLQLTAWDNHNGSQFEPVLKIGSNCQIGSYNHITAVNRIEIGNGVLTGKFVTITDNSHGIPGDSRDCDISPIKRIVYSKGPVVIEDNVWIGDKATILANVKIGRGSIVGANSVVTKDIPPYSIVVGCPAKVIKIFGTNKDV